MNTRKSAVLSFRCESLLKKVLCCAALTLPINVGVMQAQAPQGTLVVVNQQTGTVSLVDSASGNLVADIQEGAVAGHEVAIGVPDHLCRWKS